MPSLKDLRNRIASVKATQKITKAMQMVAAAKLRRAQMAAEAARPYAERMAAVLGQHRGRRDDRRRRRPGCSPAPARTRCTCWSSARPSAACAAPSTPRSPASRATTPSGCMAEGKTVKILCVGKKGYDVLRRQFGEQIIELIDLRAVRKLGFEHADTIAQKVLALFEAGEFDVATLFFSRFRSVIAQIPTAQQIIPAEIEAGAARRADAVYEYEPDEGEILGDAAAAQRLTVQIFRALLENAASEQGARMSAMDNATRNAGEMIKKQTMTYNRSRQAMITKELIEIISGAEAL